MNKTFYVMINILLFLTCVSCGEKKMQRMTEPNFGFSSNSKKLIEKNLEYKMEMALLITDEEECYKSVKELLELGADPNKKTGQLKWIDTNPLWNVCRNEKLTQLLVSYGADVTKRPYVAKAIIGRIALSDEQYNKWEKEGYLFIIPEEKALSILKTLLSHGANPNLKCIAGEKVLFPAANWNYRRYFEQHGESAINIAIKSDSKKVVKLLCEYGATPDKESLNLAKKITEQTGSPEIEDLIKIQWNLQNQK